MLQSEDDENDNDDEPFPLHLIVAYIAFYVMIH